MLGTAVTRIKDQNFQILSCYPMNDPESETLSVDEKAIDALFKPIQKEYEGSMLKSIKLQIKDFMIQLFKQPDQITLFDIENIIKYKIGFHKVGEKLVFAFLLRPLSDLELRKIEKESTGKTYFTGDPYDPVKTEEDFKH